MGGLECQGRVEGNRDGAGIIRTSLINPTKRQVVDMLGEHSIIHCICHGVPIAHDPSSSALVLGRQDASAAEYSTVKELFNIGLEKAQIAYLSACSTAENSSYKLSEESIHLASTFQLAGFAHVIAAFWEVKDKAAVPLAGLFYHNLAGALKTLDTFESPHDVVAYALHDSLHQLRKKFGNPLLWAQFVHMGA